MARKPHKHRGSLQRLNYLFGQTAQQLGENNEKRVLSAFTNEYPWENRIPWIISVRRVTLEEEPRGIDVVFVTDVGEIHVQVKSSRKSTEEFAREQESGRYSKDIICTWVSPSNDAMTICKIVTPKVTDKRLQILRRVHNRN